MHPDESKFIALLITQWPEVPRMLRPFGLPRLCHFLAIDAFVNEGIDIHSGPCIALRRELQSLDEHGVFTWARKEDG